jgi:Zn-dependent peptidase ImmA (M78 family)
MELKDLPKSFTLGAVVWDIKFDNERMKDLNAYGLCDHHKSEITLEDADGKAKRKELAIEQTLYHEVTHAILDTLKEYELSKNEEFVQKFSLLLHQFEKTKK